MSKGHTIKGQPLVALLAILAGWIGGRAINWEAPQLSGAAAATLPQPWQQPVSSVGFVIDGRVGPQSLPPRVLPHLGNAYPPTSVAGRIMPGTVAYPDPYLMPAGRSVSPARDVATLYPSRTIWREPGSGQGASGRMFMPSQGLAWPDPGQHFFAPETMPPAAAAQPVAPAPVPAAQRKSNRWSLDTWALLRRETGGGISPGVLPATYGGSQTGAVMRFRVDRASPYWPSIYARTTTALGQVRENAAALGFSARPFPEVPLIAAVEGRMTDQIGGTRFQPAAFVYTLLPSAQLPGKLRSEAYVQAGYVGGGFSTVFADGQVRLDRRVFEMGSIKGSLGAGAWGGAQKGAARFDVGPSAMLEFPLGKRMYGRAAVDWRFRVAGNARPGSGPAVTLSAGF